MLALWAARRAFKEGGSVDRWRDSRSRNKTARRAARQQRVSTRQSNRTLRSEARQDPDAVAARWGGIASVTDSAAGVASAALGGGGGGGGGGPVKDYTVPIVVGVAVVAGLVLMSKEKKK